MNLLSILLSISNPVISWLKSKPECFIHPGIAIQTSPAGDGSGLFISQPVEKDEVLFRISTNLCVSFLAAMNDEDCGSKFKALVDEHGGGARSVGM